jgi:transmembrane sensor
MSDDIDWVLLANYLSGRASLTERAAMERWIHEAPGRERQIATARELWERTGTLPDAIGDVKDDDVRRAWGSLAKRMEAAGALGSNSSVSGRPHHPVTPRMAVPRAIGPDASRRPHRPTVVAVRAAAVLLVGAGVVFLARGITHEEATPTVPPAAREVATGRGQRAEIRLDDGSRVILGVDSKLRWPTTFGVHQRDVVLEGEALFEVAHDATRPFVVRSANAVIRDLGTEFGVHAYADDRRVHVAVRSGAVELELAQAGDSNRAILRAGDAATLSTDGALHVQHDADIERELAFAEGRLELSDMPMADVARQLERWYDVRVIVSDSSLARARVSASFDRDEELSAVVRVLAASIGARAASHGRTVHFDIAH